MCAKADDPTQHDLPQNGDEARVEYADVFAPGYRGIAEGILSGVLAADEVTLVEVVVMTDGGAVFIPVAQVFSITLL